MQEERENQPVPRPTEALKKAMEWANYHLNRRFWLWVLLLILANILLKGWRAAVPGMYLDEVASTWYTQMNWPEFGDFLRKDGNPPLYYLILRTWRAVFGDDVMALRGFSVLCSSLTAGVILLSGRRLAHAAAGMVAAIVFSLSNFHYLHAQEVRTFALTSLLTALAIHGILILLQGKSKKGRLLFIVAHVLLAWSHFAAAPFFVMEFLFVGCLIFARRESGIRLIKPLAISVAFMLPLLFFLSFEKASSVSEWLSPPTGQALKDSLVIISGTQGMLWLYIGVSSFLLLSLFLKKRLPHLRMHVLLCLALGPGSILLSWIVSQWVPIFMSKYQMYTSIPAFLLLALALPQIFRLWPKKPQLYLGIPALILLVAATSFVPYFERKPFEDWKQTVFRTEELREPGDIVLLHPAYQLKSFVYYYDREAFHNYATMTSEMYEKGLAGLNELDAGFFDHQNRERYILVESHLSRDALPGRENFEECCYLQSEEWVTGIRITIFARKPGD